MKRIDKLTDIYLKAYLSSKDVITVNNVIYFRTDEFNLRKLSVNVPKKYLKNKNMIKQLLRKEIRSRIVESLGYYCGLNIYGEFEVFYKRDTPTYFRHEYKKHLKELL